MNIFGSTIGDWTQESMTLQFFWGIGLFGLVLIVIQTFFGLVVGHDGETNTDGGIDVQGGHGGGLGYLSIKSISAIALGFGFGGALLNKAGYSAGVSALGGLLVGIALTSVYLFLMNSLYRLKSDGTAILTEALNRSGTVYMRIPGGALAAGEIQVAYSGRMQNVKAYTKGPELPTGTDVRVIGLYGGSALLVEKLS